MGADVTGAHVRLAGIDPEVTSDLLDVEVLRALALGAGHASAVFVEASRRSKPAVLGTFLGDEDRALLSEALGAGPIGPSSVPPPLARRLTGGGEPAVFALATGADVLGLLVLPGPPLDPAGFASVAAHAASILGWVRMSDRVRAADFELKYRVWELESLYDVGLSIAGTLDLASLADDILMKSVSLLNARKGTLIVREAGDGEKAFVREFGGLLVSPEGSLDLPGEVLVLNDASGRPSAFAAAQAEKLLAVPIVSDGTNLGVLVVGDKENRAGGIDDFVAADARILSLFANQAAIALENARLHREAVEKEKMAREVELAASIQRTILPEEIPATPGLEMAGGNRPTRQVGGDYFDVFPLPDGSTAFCLADVSGKGIPAALLVSTVHACLHLLLDVGFADLPSVVARLNRLLYGFSATRKYATLFLARFEPASRRLRWVNAGHNPPILLRGARLELIESGGVPVGMLEGVSHAEGSHFLSPGDLLVIYSDGITEANDADDQEFGMERLTRLVKASAHLPAASLPARILEEVASFAAETPQYDDQTVLVARVS